MSETDDLEIRRKRLRFRSWHRGTREMDLLVGSFADRHLDGFNRTQVARFEALLQQSDTDLYNWMTGREAPPAALDDEIMRLMRDFKFQPITD